MPLLLSLGKVSFIPSFNLIEMFGYNSPGVARAFFQECSEDY